MTAADLPIGVFDSGVGGLTVARAIATHCPGEDILYLGDTARLPYGTKSPDTVARYAVQAARRLVERGIKLLVVACNTASAHALGELDRAFPDLPVVGVIEPGAAAAVAAAPSGRIAVLATESTVRSGAYVAALRRRAPGARIRQQACSVLVAIAEEGWAGSAVAAAAVSAYLAPLLAEGEAPEAIVLGCTHFPLLAPTIAQIAGPAIVLVDSASTTAQAVADRLPAKAGQGGLRFMATDSAERFARVAGLFLGRPIAAADVEIIDL